ncbi:MAG: 3-ketoacyl-CoA thiolase [Chloroflexi bacterium]|jgi:acetyl-CoA C-acetyltransferase|nr:3-ketoacyl-CoA thiolase [Chloroflexota bacterium]
MPGDAVIIEGARTVFGSFGGSLKDLSATELGVIASQAAIKRSGVDPAELDNVVFGNVLQTSPDAIYLARHIGLKTGLPVEVPALTVNRLCGSGAQAIVNVVQSILLGESQAALAGGAENMSQAPHVVRGARWGLSLGQGGKLEDSLWEALIDSYTGQGMAITAENLAQQYDISRLAQDEYALRSHQSALAATESGKLGEEIVPVELKDRKGNVKVVSRDEGIRPDTSLEALSRLPARFIKENGTVTAGNASGITDGAAAVVVTSADFARQRNLKPLGRVVSWGIVGVPPNIMGIGPAPAIRQALKKADLRLEDIDLVEVNEAFAAQCCAVEKDLGISRDRLNVNGGAISLGHPLGASGARVTLSVLYELRRRGGRYGIASACIGGGQGIALIVENLQR